MITTPLAPPLPGLGPGCGRAICFRKRLAINVRPFRPQDWGRGEGIPFLGFVVWPQRRRLKRRKSIHYRHRLRRLVARYQAGETPLAGVKASVLDWINHARYGNTIGLRRAILSQAVIRPPQGGSGPRSDDNKKHNLALTIKKEN